MGKAGIWGILLLLLGTLSGCGTHQEEATGTAPEEQPPVRGQMPDQESWEATIFLTREGRKMAEVWAGYMAVYNSRKRTLLKDSIHVDFFDNQGRHKSVLTAREGMIEHNTRNLVARGNVVVVSDSGIVLETEELKWNNFKQKIISDVEVKFYTPTDTLIGDSFISDADLKNYEIRNARGYSRRRVPLEK